MSAFKREYTDSPSPSEPPPLQTPPKKAKSNSSSPKKTPGSRGEDKKMGAWSSEELKSLYTIMCPKRTGVKWDEVAAQIQGRDTKACMNKWTRMQGPIQKAIEDLGEK